MIVPQSSTRETKRRGVARQSAATPAHESMTKVVLLLVLVIEKLFVLLVRLILILMFRWGETSLSRKSSGSSPGLIFPLPVAAAPAAAGYCQPLRGKNPQPYFRLKPSIHCQFYKKTNHNIFNFDLPYLTQHVPRTTHQPTKIL
jgi:hypothetical protein